MVRYSAAVCVSNRREISVLDFGLRRTFKRHNQWIEVLSNESNRGFAAGNNQAVNLTGEVLRMLNSDPLVARGWEKGQWADKSSLRAVSALNLLFLPA